MPLYEIGHLRPALGEDAWAAPSADLIGDVRLGARASVWFGAGALITEGKTFPAGSLIVGAPARVVRPTTDQERQLLRASAAHYAEKAARYAAELRTL